MKVLGCPPTKRRLMGQRRNLPRNIRVLAGCSFLGCNEGPWGQPGASLDSGTVGTPIEACPDCWTKVLPLARMSFARSETSLLTLRTIVPQIHHCYFC